MPAENPIDFSKYIVGEETLKGAARSTRALGKEVAALAKSVDGDAARIKAGLDTINAAVSAVQNKGGLLNLANPAEKKQLQDLVAEFGKLSTAKSLLRETEAAQAAAVARTTEAVKQQTTVLAQQKEALRAAAAANDVEGQQKAAAAIRATTSENKQLAAALRGMNSEFTATKGSYDALTLANSKLLAQLRGLEGGLSGTSKESLALQAQIRANTATLTDFDKQLGQNFRNVGNYPKSIQAVGAGVEGLVQNLAGAYLGLNGLAAGLQAVIESNIKFSDQAADVRKTTGLTADEFDRLADSLKQFDTRTSLSGLLEIAKVGGQLGITKGDILGFTKAVDIAVQALGDDFEGGAEQIATELGKIASVFKKELGPDVSQNLLSIGSAVNEIGAVGAATAPFLTDVALRVGAVASQAGVGLKNVLAYAAVLQETGFSAETSGTALNRFFSVLSTRTEESFRIAQKANPALTLKQFTTLVNTDFNQAIQVFLKGLNAGGKTTTELSAMLSTLKLQSGEAKNAIITLAQNTDLFADRQKTANDQLRDATSLAAEAAVKNDTLAGSVGKLTNGISNFFVSGAAGRFIKFFVDLKDAELGAAGNILDGIGDGITRLAQKAGLAEKPQEDFTVKVVSTVQALEKQAGAQQQLLDSYTQLAGTANRTEGQRLALAQTRAQLIAKFGTDEVETIQQRINNELLAAESHKKVLRADLAGYDESTQQLISKSASYQEQLNQQEAGFTAKQIARAKEVAQARLSPNYQAGGKSLNPELEPAIAANIRLLKTEQELAIQQRTRSNILAALAKLTPANTKAVQDAAAADAAAADSAEELDRAGKERAKNRVQDLKDELAANQKRIADLKQYMAEQARLLDDGQLDRQVFAQRAAGAEDLLTQLQRNGEAVRIRLVRAESAEKLKEADNDRIRQRNKKNVTEAELTDIEGQYAARRIGLARNEKREIAKIKDERADALRVEPINFIAPLDTKSFKKEMEEVARIRQRGFDQQEEQVDEAGRKQQAALDEEVRRVKEAEQRKRDLREKGIEVGVALGDSFFQNQRNNLDAQQAAEQFYYDQSIKQAGDNAELKEAIDAEHQQKDLALRRKQAENDRQQAVFNIIVKLAEATMTELSRYGLPFALPFIAGDAALAALQFASLPPIPQFFKGVRGLATDVPLATIAEKGPELVREKATGKFRYHAKPAFTSLGRGDDVYTAEETQRMLASAHADMQQLQQPLGFGSNLVASTAAIQAGRNQGAEQAGELRQIRKAMQENTAAMKNLKQVTLNVNGEVQGALVQHGDSLTRSLNQRLINYGG